MFYISLMGRIKQLEKLVSKYIEDLHTHTLSKYIEDLHTPIHTHTHTHTHTGICFRIYLKDWF